MSGTVYPSSRGSISLPEDMTFSVISGQLAVEGVRSHIRPVARDTTEPIIERISRALPPAEVAVSIPAEEKKAFSTAVYVVLRIHREIQRVFTHCGLPENLSVWCHLSHLATVEANGYA
jgi:hypothetical protein